MSCPNLPRHEQMIQDLNLKYMLFKGVVFTMREILILILDLGEGRKTGNSGLYEIEGSIFLFAKIWNIRKMSRLHSFVWYYGSGFTVNKLGRNFSCDDP